MPSLHSTQGTRLRQSAKCFSTTSRGSVIAVRFIFFIPFQQQRKIGHELSVSFSPRETPICSQQSLSNARFSIYSFPSLSILKIFHVPKAFGSATMRKANTSLSFCFSWQQKRGGYLRPRPPKAMIFLSNPLRSLPFPHNPPPRRPFRKNSPWLRPFPLSTACKRNGVSLLGWQGNIGRLMGIKGIRQESVSFGR